jgi:hypothetical protein
VLQTNPGARELGALVLVPFLELANPLAAAAAIPSAPVARRASATWRAREARTAHPETAPGGTAMALEVA